MALGPKPVAGHAGLLVGTLTFLLTASITVGTGRVADQTFTPTAPRTIPANEGVVQGRIVDARSGRPVPGATVDLDGPGGVTSATSDTEGRYESGSLEPGEYRVRARAQGYVPTQYGQRETNDRGSMLDVPGGQLTTGIDLRLHPAGAVSGRIFDERGEGVAGIEVELIAERYTPNGPAPRPVAFAQTDEAGAFRISNVLPGDYYVRAYVPGAVRPSGGKEPQVYRATFLPGVPHVQNAQALRIAAGQELFGADFALLATQNRRVSGTVTDLAALADRPLHVGLIGIGSSGPRRHHDAVVDGNGRFEIRDVTPGDYMVSVFDPTPGSPNSRWAAATRQIAVEDDITELELRARTGARIEGRIMRDPEAARPLDPSTVTVEFEIRLESSGWISSRSGFGMGADGIFYVESPGGESAIRVSGVPASWVVKAIRLDGRDITDETIDFGDGVRRGLEIVLTDRACGDLSCGRRRTSPRERLDGSRCS